MKNKKKTRYITESAVIAALYVALTLLSASAGLSGGPIQFRLSEALCTLAYFTPAAIPGLFAGCFISNILCGSIIADVVFGSLATLAGAALTYFIRKFPPFLSPVPTIVANIAVVPFILKYGYGADNSVMFFVATVGIGEIACSGILGLVLLFSVKRTRILTHSEK